MEFSRASSLISLVVLFYCCADTDALKWTNIGIPSSVVAPKPISPMKPVQVPAINPKPISPMTPVQVPAINLKPPTPPFFPDMRSPMSKFAEAIKRKNNPSPTNVTPVPRVPEQADLASSLSNTLQKTFSSGRSSTNSGDKVPTNVATTKISGSQKNNKNVNSTPQPPSTPSAVKVATSEPEISATMPTTPPASFVKTVSKEIASNVANTALSTVVASGVNYGLIKVGVISPPVPFVINSTIISPNPSTIDEILNQSSSSEINNRTETNPSDEIKVYIQNLTEDLFQLEKNTMNDYIQIDLQKQISNESLTEILPNPLFVKNQGGYKSPIVNMVLKLWANYKNDAMLEEIVTPESTSLEETLLDLIVETPLIKRTMEFYFVHKIIPNDVNEFKNVIRQMFFTRFARFPENGKIGSSGFESIFSYESANNLVYGFTNWIYCAKHSFKYYGYEKEIKLGKNISALKIWIKKFKKVFPLNILVGTSPEFEIALYTICANFYPNVQCPVKLGGIEFNINTSIYKNGNSTQLK